MHKFCKYIIIVIQIFFLISCGTVSQISSRDVAFLYNSGQNKIKAEYAVFNRSDEFSTLYYRVRTSDLLYAKPNNSNVFNGGVKLTYMLMKDFDSKEVADSATVFRIDSSAGKRNEYLLDSLNFKAKRQRSYVIHLKITDINRKSFSENYILVDKSSAVTQQDFLLRNSDNSPAFKNYFASAESFRISAGDGKREKLYVKRFKDQFTAAYPPFSDKKDGRIVLKPDSLFVISLKDNVTAPLTLKKPGIYYFQPDTAIKKGLTVLRYYDDYPEITSPANMLNPLLYLTSKSEYDKILMLKDKKTGIDNFWIEIAGNPDRARQLIIKYYTRVKEANQMFISHTEGWKTDRGIIYIVYGQPNVVYKNADNETWIYGSVNSPRSIRFNFYKTLNPFSDNDFVLDRSQNYKNSWYVAVEAWRR